MFNIYINTCSLFDCHCYYGLDDAIKNVEIFHYDRLNTIFYAKDNQITKLLDVLSNWYVKAKKENHIAQAKIKLEQAEIAFRKAQENCKTD